MLALLFSSFPRPRLPPISRSCSTVSLSRRPSSPNYLGKLQAKGKAAHLSAIESGLLMRINQDLPSEIGERLAVLRTKREDETITDTAYEELTRLTDQAEELHAARMAALVELATLRGLPLPVLMDQLGMHFPEPV